MKFALISIVALLKVCTANTDSQGVKKGSIRGRILQEDQYFVDPGYETMDMDAMDEEYEMPKVLSEEEYSSYRKVTKEETRMRDEANINEYNFADYEE